MSRYSLFLFIAFFLVLVFLSKPFRRFSIRATLGVSTLLLAKFFNFGISLNYIGIALASLLGIPGAVSFVAISKILA